MTLRIVKGHGQQHTSDRQQNLLLLLYDHHHHKQMSHRTTGENSTDPWEAPMNQRKAISPTTMTLHHHHHHCHRNTSHQHRNKLEQGEPSEDADFRKGVIKDPAYVISSTTQLTHKHTLKNINKPQLDPKIPLQEKVQESKMAATYKDFRA